MTHACERLKLDRSGDDDESLMKKLFFSALVFVLSFVLIEGASGGLILARSLCDVPPFAVPIPM
jgi:hypothetical protein